MALKFKFNPITGQLDLVDIPSVGSSIHIQKFTLSATDITNKYVVLSDNPTNDNLTIVFFILEHKYNDDYVITADDGGKRLSWDGKGLETIILAGDELTVIFD